MGAVSVYTCFDRYGDLVYIGQTGWGFARFDDHATRDWPSVARVEFEPWPDKPTATVREFQLIQTHVLGGLLKNVDAPEEEWAWARLDRLAPRYFGFADPSVGRSVEAGDLLDWWWDGQLRDDPYLRYIARALGTVIGYLPNDQVPRWHEKWLRDLLEAIV